MFCLLGLLPNTLVDMHTQMCMRAHMHVCVCVCGCVCGWVPFQAENSLHSNETSMEDVNT